MLNRVQRRARQQYKEEEHQYSTRDEEQICSDDSDYPMCSSPLLAFGGSEEEDLWDSDVDADGDVPDI